MVFWGVVIVLIVVGLGLAIRADRKHKGTRVNPDQPDAARGQTAARVQHERLAKSDWNQLG